jgi:hypothetical protein
MLIQRAARQTRIAEVADTGQSGMKSWTRATCRPISTNSMAFSTSSTARQNVSKGRRSSAARRGML